MVVNQSGWDFFQFIVYHLIAAYDHGTFLFVKGCNDGTQYFRAVVEVVAIQLNGELAALGMVDGLIPAPSDSQFSAFGDEVEQGGRLAAQFF